MNYTTTIDYIKTHANEASLSLALKVIEMMAIDHAFKDHLKRQAEKLVKGGYSEEDVYYWLYGTIVTDRCFLFDE